MSETSKNTKEQDIYNNIFIEEKEEEIKPKSSLNNLLFSSSSPLFSSLSEEEQTEETAEEKIEKFKYELQKHKRIINEEDENINLFTKEEKEELNKIINELCEIIEHPEENINKMNKLTKIFNNELYVYFCYDNETQKVMYNTFGLDVSGLCIEYNIKKNILNLVVVTLIMVI